MKKFLYSHPNFIIGAISGVFIGVLLVFYFWAINNVLIQLRLALIAPPPQNATGFDLAAAAKLDLRGLMNGTSSAPAAPAPATTTGVY